tara:strand:+ start:486 stop:728 length:243 start_codon:yes stop_codon:yes gene_type:complete
MNDRCQANQLLDQHKETHQLSYADTTRALALTGDLEADGSEGVGAEIPQESERPWENPSINLVVTGLLRHRKTAWISRRR